MKKIYMGYAKGGGREVFHSDVTPTEATHGDKYLAVMGPFRTMRGAKFAAEYGQGNPHIQTVGDAERLALKSA